ncbi:hypothetical protein [Paraflavitalea speifideaquila]|uniref:hypothetical protein n=1 Tax=Paraflavitalea speifideaquila TaxID=3076558 RepID=UPI00331306A3
MAIESVRKGEEEKLSVALHQLPEEDPTIRVEFSQELKQTIIHCLGELHLTVIRWRIEHLHGVEVKFSRPRIPYRETIRRMAESNYRHKNNPVAMASLVKYLCASNPGTKAWPIPKASMFAGAKNMPSIGAVSWYIIIALWAAPSTPASSLPSSKA